MAKIVGNGFIITAAVALSLTLVVRLLLHFPDAAAWVWPQFLAVFGIGLLFFVLPLRRFRRITAASIA